MRRTIGYRVRLRVYSKRKWLDWLSQEALKDAQKPAGPPPRPKRDGYGRLPSQTPRPEPVGPNPSRTEKHYDSQDGLDEWWERKRRPEPNPGQVSTRFADTALATGGAVLLPAPLILQVYTNWPMQAYHIMSLIGGFIMGWGLIHSDTPTRSGGPR